MDPNRPERIPLSLSIFVLASLLLSVITSPRYSAQTHLSPGNDHDHNTKYSAILNTLHEVSTTLQQIQTTLDQKCGYDYAHTQPQPQPQSPDPDAMQHPAAAAAPSESPGPIGDKVIKGMLTYLLISVGLMGLFQSFAEMDAVRRWDIKRRMIEYGVPFANLGLMVMLAVFKDMVWYQYIIGALCSFYVGILYSKRGMGDSAALDNKASE